jgi:hypothetical protein
MSKVLVNESSLSSIANAIREKNGLTDTYKPGEMATAIINLPTGGGGDIEVEPIVLTGDCQYLCKGPIASNYIKLFGNTISAKDITNCSNMFHTSSLTKIPFDIVFRGKYVSNDYAALTTMFGNSYWLTELPLLDSPNVAGVQGMFSNCYRLREISEDYCDTWNWNYLNTNQYTGGSSIFSSCYSLRKIPEKFLNHMYSLSTTTYSSHFSSTFSYCYVLDEIKGVGVCPATYTSNMFGSHIERCHRLKTYTFQTNEDGTPKTAKWKSQILDFSSYVGYAYGSVSNKLIEYNSGITADKQVKDDATYQALKDNPDWFTLDINYSRYNHDSAVETINSLPDCSATGTNTIKFKGAAGALTDGGAINTLTEEEIAVAAAKGWTVSFA